MCSKELIPRNKYNFVSQAIKLNHYFLKILILQSVGTESADLIL